MKTKAIVLFSGGLDSRLAIKILQEQDIDIIAVMFKLPFGGGCCNDEMCSFRFSQTHGVKLRIEDYTKGKNFQEYIRIIRNPEHGRGTAMNPCIDCHLFMLKKAKEIMKKEKADFIATGEVLNERPMSQNFKALQIIEQEAGLKGKLLRPLSAKLLPETEAEKKKLIDRSKLLDINGRSRQTQMQLAEKYKLKYPSPAGGCILCESEFARKLRDLIKNQKKIDSKDIELLKIGRHFRIDGTKIIVGRNHDENKKLIILAKNSVKMEVKDIPSPITVILGKADKKTIEKAAELTLRYSDADEGIVVYGKGKFDRKIKAKAISEEEISKLRV